MEWIDNLIKHLKNEPKQLKKLSDQVVNLNRELAELRERHNEAVKGREDAENALARIKAVYDNVEVG